MRPLKWNLSAEIINPSPAKPIPKYILSAKPYQLEGVAELIRLHEAGIAGILGWPMGFGKTLGAILLILHEIAQEGPHKNILIYTPNDIRDQFMEKVVRFITKAQFFTS